MCGGAGTRQWPVSRDSMPKQFISLFGSESTCQRTMRMLSDRSVFDSPIVVTNADYRFTAQDQLRQIGLDAEIVLEPDRRDSAPAVATATELALARREDAVVGVFAADHVVQDARLFVETCQRAGRVAAQQRIITIGIPPTHPATGYGYVRQGAQIEEGARWVEAFVEKPDAERAARYLLEGYLWNSGNLIFCARTMRAELEAFAPDVAVPVARALEAARRDLDFLLLDADAFAAARKISLDYAVMERTSKAAVTPGAFGWSDVGGWAAVWDLAPKDEAGKAVFGRGYVLDGKDNLIRAKGESEAGEHRKIQRPWGKYLSVDLGERHQIKRITVKPGGVLSLQKHDHRAEHWVVVRGAAEVTRNGEVVVMHEKESNYLPIGCVHRMANPGKIPLELIEVQVGSYLGADDILRGAVCGGAGRTRIARAGAPTVRTRLSARVPHLEPT